MRGALPVRIVSVMSPRAFQAAAGYAITLEAAPADDLASLLMRAWGLTRREREVARLVIDGLPTEAHFAP
jgi:hypothetical protein